MAFGNLPGLNMGAFDQMYQPNSFQPMGQPVDIKAMQEEPAGEIAKKLNPEGEKKTPVPGQSSFVANQESSQEQYDHFKVQQRINELQREFNELAQKKSELENSITGLQTKFASDSEELERAMAANRARRIKKDNESTAMWRWSNEQKLKKEQIRSEAENRKETSRRTLTSAVTDQLSKIDSNITFYRGKAAMGTTAEKEAANNEIARLEQQRDYLISKAKANGIDAADFWNFKEIGSTATPTATPTTPTVTEKEWPANVWDKAYDAETFGETGAVEQKIKAALKERENQTNAALVAFADGKELPKGFTVESKTAMVDDKSKPLKSGRGYKKKKVTTTVLKDPTGKEIKKKVR